jgi:ribose transport system permease protein
MTKSVTKGSTVAVPQADRLRGVLKTEVVLGISIVLLVAVAFLKNPNFLQPDNIKITLRDSAMLAIVAIGVGFPILTGGIDLSVGSMVGFGGVMAAYFMMVLGLPIWLAIVLTLGLGVAVGAFNGLYVTKLHMHGFLITLVTMGLARGFILVLTGSFPITGLPMAFNFIGQGYLFNLVPIPVVICAVVAVLCYYLLRYTYIGRQIYAVGGNVEAARYSGVAVDARVFLCYIISVVCAVTVGMITAGRLTMGHPGSGEGEELLAITACILGGASFSGGEGGVPGILLGAILMGTLSNAMVMVNIDPLAQKIVISLVLLAAVTFDYARRLRK